MKHYPPVSREVNCHCLVFGVSPFLPLSPLRVGGRLVGELGGEPGFLIGTQIAQFELYNGIAVSQVTGSLSNSLQKETTCMLKSSTNTHTHTQSSPGLELETSKLQLPVASEFSPG